ncbi:MAG TPA: ABC transporter substrate-binding protein [Xanthobacteraceae bacterium]|nr:ABC transporter substrate-binding protein [Xanthobacteraceae bacterium]
MRWPVVCGIAAAATLAIPAGTAAQPASLSGPEKIYAELAALPKAERSRRIEAGARAEGKLVLVHTLRGSLGAGHVELFHKRYPFLTLDVAGEVGSQDAAERLLAEESAGRHLTDAIVTAVMDLDELIRRNQVARYPTPAVDAILPRYRAFIDPESRWIPWFWSEHGISYNTSLVPPRQAPRSWNDLCNPFFRGGVSFDPAENRFLSGLNAMLGEAATVRLLECIGANAPIIQRGHTQRMELMLAGDHMVQGDNYLYQGVAMKRKIPATPFAIAYSAPIIATNDVAAINRNAPNPYAAALFADWTLSEESQAYLAAQLRGPVTLPHPYLPDEVKLIDNVDPPKEVMDRLLAAWFRYVEKPK